MGLRVFNTASREMEEFVPQIPGKVGMYVCGPTTYDLCHVGHARVYVAFDIIRRYLEYLGYEVNYVQNFTDVDDKIINRAREKGMAPLELAHHYIDEYYTDMKMLGVRDGTHHPYASETVPEMIDVIQGLIQSDFAYEVNGNVYFSVESASDKVGTLTRQPLEDMMDGARVDINPEKRHPKDFALWKSSQGEEIFWDSPWGKGRPGWHIECSTMSTNIIGPTLDIHGGGRDLIFPHHESEILQSECYTGQAFCRYWLHNGFVTINSEKMSKSLGNFFTIRDVLKKYSPAVLRFFLSYTHYRRPIDFCDEHLEEATRSLERIRNTIITVRRYLDQITVKEKDSEAQISPINSTSSADTSQDSTAFISQGMGYAKDFISSMNEDFNTREAIAAVFNMCRLLNKGVNDSVDPKEMKTIFRELENHLGILGFTFEMILDSRALDDESPDSAGLEDDLVELLIDIRTALRKERKWELSDRIRDGLAELGVELQDLKEGTIFKRNS